MTPSADSTQVYYQPGFHPGAQVAYFSNGAYAQQNHNFNMPLYYVNGVPTVQPSVHMNASGNNTQHSLNASQQQYYVQQSPSGHLLYIPRQVVLFVFQVSL